MTMVRFATTCDLCGKRSAEYTAWPSCENCIRDTCPECRLPDLVREADADQQEISMCLECATVAV